MDYIIRPKYLKKINQFVDKPVVKILTGMRRVGKSTLLNIIQNEILKGIPRKNKIYINFESLEFFHIKEAASLRQYLSPLLERIHG
ncbi:MAG: AAA family ATPase, partial [Fusobacterium necrophorum]|nr:AAA family ATPase [Fusobacterium necrophorum]